MGFRSPLTAAQIAAIVGGVVPTAAENAAATDAAANSVAAANQSATAASQSATAASQSAVARIRSMTRVSFTMSTTDTDVTVSISVVDINRCQVSLIGTKVGGGTSLVSTVPGVSSVTNSSVTLSRANTGNTAGGYVEVMEWI